MTEIAAVCEQLLDALADPRQLASALDLKPARERNKYACPACSSTDALSLTVPDGRVRVKCFSCDVGGDALTLVAIGSGYPAKPQGRDFLDVLRAGAEIAGRQDLLADLDAGRNRERVATRAPRPARPEPAPVYPPAGEAEAMWFASRPVTENDTVTRYLEGRGIDTSELWARGLARVLSASAPTYAWASFGSRSWFEAGFVIVVPVYDASGAIRALRAWSPAPASGMPKRVAAKGCTTRGLVMADFLGQAMLDGTHQPEHLVVAEGEPDFLTWATRGSLLDVRRWATLGIESGAWTEQIAARVPDGARVTIATDHDEPGERYAAAVAKTLEGRCVLLRTPKLEVAS